MSIHSILDAIQSTPMATAIRETGWLFPTIECVHVLAITFVVGTIAMVDLRLLGFTSRGRAVTRLTAEVLPWTWGGFVVAVATGTLLFASAEFRLEPDLEEREAELPDPVRERLELRRADGAGAAEFVSRFQQTTPPVVAKVTGALSLLFWCGVIAAGRWIGFTDSGF